MRVSVGYEKFVLKLSTNSDLLTLSFKVEESARRMRAEAGGCLHSVLFTQVSFLIRDRGEIF